MKQTKRCYDADELHTPNANTTWPEYNSELGLIRISERYFSSRECVFVTHRKREKE